MSALAIFGGAPALAEPLSKYRSVGERERQAVIEVIDSGCLSGFYGDWGPEFLGGPKVQAFEAAWSKQFACAHTVSVNSATSGLFAAVGAANVGPGDEVIVPPYTMSATAMAPLVYGGIPVFVDIEPETYCLDPELVRQAIGPRTRAIIVVNLFGHPAQLAELRALADQHGLILIEDNAQGPLAMEGGKYAGTIGDIGIFSLNYHKHIHTGEGGMCVTDDEILARRLQAVRNHGENVIGVAELGDFSNIVGFNYRMTELSAAVGLAQLSDAERHVMTRQGLAEALSEGLADLEGVTVPTVRDGCRHVYYTWSARLDAATLGVSRETFCRALLAEGFPIYAGYVKPLYELPVFQQRRAFGRDGYPFNLTERQYHEGLCPVAERMHNHELVFFETCAFDVGDQQLEELIAAFRKVHANRHELTQLNSQ
jgi:perosamine synthetase